MSDVGRSLAFYRMLGIDAVNSATTGRYATVRLPSGLRVEWTESSVRQRNGSACPEGVVLSVRCGSPAEVDATTATVGEAGHEIAVDPHDTRWGTRTASVTDPDGNLVDLYAPYP